jgi:hypothetical protein
MTDAALLRRLAAAALIASAVIPTEVVRGGPVICPFRAVTGRPCPSCGMTRSWSAMGHGRLRDAGGKHLFGPITFAAALAIVAGGEPLAAALLEPKGRSRTALGLLGAAWSLFWAWRLATEPVEARG